MKKLLAYFWLLTCLLMVGTNFAVVRAQTLLKPVQAVNLQPSILSLTATQQPLTAEAQPQVTVPAGTTTTTGSGTQQSAGTTTGTKPSTSGNTTGTQNLPSPDLPVLDIGTPKGQTSTQETTQQCPSALTSATCIDPNQAQATILPPVLNNQIKISLLVFLGACLGTILWILSSWMINSARGKRDTLRFARQQRLRMNNLRAESLQKSYGRLTSSLGDLLKYSGNKAVLNMEALNNFKKASINLELFGSDESLAAHNKLTALLSGSRLPAAEEIEAARSDLLHKINKDLGFVPSAHGPVPSPSGHTPSPEKSSSENSRKSSGAK